MGTDQTKLIFCLKRVITIKQTLVFSVWFISRNACVMSQYSKGSLTHTSHCFAVPVCALHSSETSGMLLYCSSKYHFQKIVFEGFFNGTRKTALPCHRIAFLS